MIDDSSSVSGTCASGVTPGARRDPGPGDVGPGRRGLSRAQPQPLPLNPELDREVWNKTQLYLVAVKPLGEMIILLLCFFPF